MTIGAIGTQTGSFASGLALRGIAERLPGDNKSVVTNQTDVESTTFVAPSADLQVTITDSPDPIVLGTGQIAYTVTVTNLGPQPANDVVFEGLVAGPAGADSATTPRGPVCTAQGAAVNCRLGTIVPGGVATITVLSLPTATGSVTLSGFATSTENDPDRSNNSTHQNTTVVAPQIASIAVTPSPASVVVGQAVQLTATATLTDGSTQDVTSSVTWASLNAPFATVDPAGLVTGVAAGTATIRAEHTASGVFGTAIVNVSGPPVPPSINVGVANLQVLSGQDPGFFVEVDTGSGGTGVALDFSLSAGILQQVTPPAGGVWSCSGVLNNAIQCVAASVAAAQNLVFSVLSSTPASTTGQTTMTLTATLNYLSPVFTLQDFIGSLFVPSPLLAVFKLDSADPIELRPGSTLIYTFQISNIGNAPATNARLLDSLPPSMVFVSAQPASLGCTPGPPVNCPLGTINPGDPPIIVEIHVQPTQVGSFQNTAVVNQNEAVAIQGQDSETTTVLLPPIVSVAITPNSSVLQANQIQPLSLIATLANGTQLDYTQFATWTSSNDVFASVSTGFGTAGNVTANSPGTVTITAAIPGTQLSASALVRVNQPPVSIFLAATPCPDLGCHFDGTASSDADGTIVKFEWNYGDGRIESNTPPASPSRSPFHIYSAPGTYRVTLTVTDNDGATAVAFVDVTVTTSSAADMAAIIQSISESPYHTRGGRPLEIAVRYQNDGPDPSGEAQVTTTASGGLLSTVQSSSPGATCVIDSAGSSSTCSVTGVAAGGFLDIIYVLDPAAITGAQVSLLTGIAAGALDSNQSNNAASASIPINIAAPTSLTISGNTGVIAGQSTPLTATLHFADGSTLDVTNNITWTSGATGTATVNSSGVVTGVTAGTASITALHSPSGLQASVDVIVSAPPPTAESLCAFVLSAAGILSHAIDVNLVSLANQTLSLGGLDPHSIHVIGNFVFVVARDPQTFEERILVFEALGGCVLTQRAVLPLNFMPSRCGLAQQGDNYFLFLGEQGQGVHTFHFDSTTSSLVEVQNGRFLQSTSFVDFIKVHPSGEFVAVVADNQLHVHRINADGSSTPASGSPSSFPSGFSSPAFSPDGTRIFFGSSNIVVSAPFDPATGAVDLSPGQAVLGFPAGAVLYMDAGALTTGGNFLTISSFGAFSSMLANGSITHAPGSPYLSLFTQLAVTPIIIRLPNNDLIVGAMDQAANTVMLFRVDASSGSLVLPAGLTIPIPAGAPDLWALVPRP